MILKACLNTQQCHYKLESAAFAAYLAQAVTLIFVALESACRNYGDAVSNDCHGHKLGSPTPSLFGVMLQCLETKMADYVCAVQRTPLHAYLSGEIANMHATAATDICSVTLCNVYIRQV